MEYTTNYHLPQWVESDRIMMGDFNQMCSDIDGGILQAQEAADAAQSAADNAQNTANTAQASADAAQAEAAKLPYVVGSYTGSGGGMTVELGFRPSFLIISGATISYSTDRGNLGAYSIITAGNILPNFVVFTDTGFTINPAASNEYPKLTENIRVYDYIAFR